MEFKKFKLGEKMPVSWTDSFLDFFFPPVCLICGIRIVTGINGKNTFCSRCATQVLTVGWFCLRCKSTGVEKLPCACLLREQKGLARLYGAAWYEGKWRATLHRFKYYSQPQMARKIGSFLGELISHNSYWPLPNVVTAIPLHGLKLKERGYNQSALLARKVAKELKVPFKPLLCRVKNNVSQTSLSFRERRNNIDSVFMALPNSHQQISGKSILLIDDIFTTGATMEEAAKTLLSGGAREVNGAVAAIQRKIF